MRKRDADYLKREEKGERIRKLEEERERVREKRSGRKKSRREG